MRREHDLVRLGHWAGLRWWGRLDSTTEEAGASPGEAMTEVPGTHLKCPAGGDHPGSTC